MVLAKACASTGLGFSQPGPRSVAQAPAGALQAMRSFLSLNAAQDY